MINSSINKDDVKLVYNVPKLEESKQWQLFIQTISLPIGVGNVEFDPFPSEEFYELY